MKKMFALGMLAGVLALVGNFASAQTPQAVSAAKSTQVKFTEIETGTHSGLAKQQEVLRNQADWKKLWEKHKSRGFPVPALPTVDFTKEMVVVLCTGSQSSGGHSVRVVSVEDDGTSLVVTYRVTEPEPGKFYTAVITDPFTLVKVPVSSKPVKFVRAK